MKKITNQEIIDLLNKGFNPSVLAFEFDIPIETINKLKNELNFKNINAEFKIKKLRDRYNEFVNEKSITEVNSNSKKLNKNDGEFINFDFEQRIEKIKNYKILNKIIDEVKQSNFTIEQYEELYKIILKKINKLLIEKSPNVNAFDKIKFVILSKLVQEINNEVILTQDINYLKLLLNKLNADCFKECMLLTDRVKDKIDRKINLIKQNEIKNKIGEDDEISNIIYKIINGESNIEEITNLIKIEAEKRYENAPKNKFALTLEKHITQIKIQINNILTNKAEKYQIKDIEYTMEILRQLSNEDYRIVTIVVKNLIGNKKYQEARNMCYKNSGNNGYRQPEYIRSLEKDIVKSETSDIILKIINGECTNEEQVKTFNYLEEQIKSGRINISSIILGKNIEGKNVTLNDIWNDEIQKSR